MLSHFSKLVCLFLLAIAATALPAPFTPLDSALCTSEYITVSGKRVSCEPFITATVEDADMAIHDMETRAASPPSKNYCIIVCAHAWCRPLCSNPGSAGIDETATDLLATTNAQPDKLGFAFTPGTTTIVLGQNDEQKCAWLCSAESLSCKETCWAEGVQDAAVTYGGTLSGDEVVGGLTECRIVDKGEVGKLISCEISVSADVHDVDWNNMRCNLFWRDYKPQLECHKF